MFSYILVVSTGYILLISNYCPMLKARKIKSIASQVAMLYFQIYLKINLRRVQKYVGFLLNCTKISLTVLQWSSQRSALQVHFKVESVLQSRRKKMKFCSYVARWLPSQLANEKKWEQLQLTLDNSNPKKDKAMKRICSRQ